jgi:integrase
MGSVFNRGTRDKPRFVAKFRDADGRWKQRPLKGAATKTEARGLLAAIEKNVTEGRAGLLKPVRSPSCAALMREWAKQIDNRGADEDRYRVEKHLIPVFGHRTIHDVEDVRVVMRWLASMKSEAKIGAWTQRNALHCLSRFFAWAIEEGHATINPCRQVPRGKRPSPSVRRDAPWLDDEALVRKAFHALPQPINFIFYFCTSSGLRPGEAAGLRLSDLDTLADGGAPAPEGAAEVVSAWLVRRRQEGAGPEDFAFPNASGLPFEKKALGRAWKAAREKAGIPESVTFYLAGRHTFASRNLSRGASLDEVSAALGHSTPLVTRRHYDHFVRKNFSPVLREGAGIEPASDGGEVVSLRGKRAR